MKERLTNNLGLKLLAIFLAFFVWLLVANVSNPIVRGSKEVQVTILNEQVLADNNLTYEVSGKSAVTVNYEVHTLDAYKISAADFYAYVNLSELYAVTGSIPVKIEILNNRDLIQGQPYTTPGVLEIITEPIQRKQFDLQTHVTGTPETGYVVGEITVKPDTIYVTGARSAIGNINSVGIEFSVEGANSDFTGLAKPIFYNSNGNELNRADDTSLDIEEVTYEVTVLKEKTLELDYRVAGSVADDYRFTGVESDVNSVKVKGTPASVDQLTALVIPAAQLNLNDAAQDVILQVDLQKLLPQGITIVDGEPTEANISLKVEPLVTRGFRLDADNVQLLNTVEGYEYTLNRQAIQINIQGLSEDLDELERQDLTATMDVRRMSAGVNQGTLQLELQEGLEMVSHETVEVMVEVDESDADESGAHEASANIGTAADSQENTSASTETPTTGTHETTAGETITASE